MYDSRNACRIDVNGFLSCHLPRVARSYFEAYSLARSENPCCINGVSVESRIAESGADELKRFAQHANRRRFLHLENFAMRFLAVLYASSFFFGPITTIVVGQIVVNNRIKKLD